MPLTPGTDFAVIHELAHLREHVAVAPAIFNDVEEFLAPLPGAEESKSITHERIANGFDFPRPKLSFRFREAQMRRFRAPQCAVYLVKEMIGCRYFRSRLSKPTLSEAFLKSTVKNPEKANKFRSVLLQIRDQINLLFPGE